MKHKLYDSLRRKDMDAAMASENPDQFIISGKVFPEFQKVVLVTGAFNILDVPFTAFPPNATCSPDFTKFSIGEGGGTIILGDYEALALHLYNHKAIICAC